MENTETNKVIVSFEEAKKVSDAERKLLDLLIAKNLLGEPDAIEEPKPTGQIIPLS
ncbi:hypothetical protein ACSSZE_09485 [Acidithiobacillus caldus]